MKRFLVLVFFFFSIVTQIIGQDFYLNFKSGYGLGVSPREYTSFTETQIEEGNYINTTKSQNFSFGNGYYFGGTFGYYLTPAIGIDLELQYMKGGSLEVSSNSNSFSGSWVSSNEISGRSYYIIPSLFLSTDIGLFKPYMKFGAIIGSVNITNEITSNNQSNGTSYNWEYEYKYTGGTALGLNASIGTFLKISNNFSLVFEANSKNLSFAPTEGKLENFRYNGVNQLEQMPVYMKEIQFVENYESTSGEIDITQPQKTTQNRYPFSSIVISFGVAIWL